MKKLLPVLCGLLLACNRPSPAPTGSPDGSVAVAPVAVAPKEEPARADAGAPPEAPRETGAGAPRCSASTLSPEPKPAKPPLPAKVESMRRRIIAAAVACDYETLTALSLEEGKEFNPGSGGETDLAAFWRKQEQQGDPVLARLVRVLNLPYSGEGEHYLWPSAAGMFRKAKDWEAIEGLYPPETIARWKGTEKGYTGLRTGIHLNGDWLFAMSGE
ncbi:hypothetical protein [Archangium sp.]|uniref:hypothetical protein n=1 Tax=Archangium sp. TaxID=1872627 RepID=UPI002D4A9574|nr:hypothetical protein [Archangium sp.]HYO57098.1 hypothetical protein [Archangium sp.]